MSSDKAETCWFRTPFDRHSEFDGTRRLFLTALLGGQEGLGRGRGAGGRAEDMGGGASRARRDPPPVGEQYEVRHPRPLPAPRPPPARPSPPVPPAGALPRADRPPRFRELVHMHGSAFPSGARLAGGALTLRAGGAGRSRWCQGCTRTACGGKHLWCV